MNFVRPSRMILPENPKTWELSFNAALYVGSKKLVEDIAKVLKNPG
jgi:hypothetical protein